MKRIAVAVIVLCAFALIGCKTQPSGPGPGPGPAPTPDRHISSSVPPFVRDILRNQPEDALIGIGMANMRTMSQSRTMAATRARAEISRQMSTMIQDMIRDYTAGSEVDHSAALSFQENITVALSKAELVGAKEVGFDEFPVGSGNWWVVIEMGPNNTVQMINQAQAAAKLAVPAMASFNAEDRMNAAFANAYKQEVGYAGD